MSSLFTSPPGTTSLTNNQFGRQYPDPFVTQATLAMPRTIEELMRWSEQLWLRNGAMTKALKRVIRYFLTELDLTCNSDDERKRLFKFFTEKLKVMGILAALGDDFVCYGEAYRSLYVPFTRTLRCTSCAFEQPISRIEYKFSKTGFSFKCGSCGTQCTCDRPVDRPSKDETKLRVKNWSPHEIRVREHPSSGNCTYYWDPPADICRQVQSGDRFVIDEMPWEMVEAALARRLFKFYDRVIFHAKMATVSGVRARGRGIPDQLSNFPQAYYVQILKMYNEVLASDYMVPFRVVSPQTGAASVSDPAQGGVSISNFNRQAMRMFEQHRRHPGGYFSIPVPMNFQNISGDGIKFSTHELIAQAMDDQLNASGVPIDFYKGTMTIQTAPVGLRLLASTWVHLTEMFDSFLVWLMEGTCEVMTWEKAQIALKKPTLTDDVERLGVLLQLAAGNQISKEVAYAPLGVDPDEDEVRLLNEQRRSQERQQKFQDEIQHKQMLMQQMASPAQQAAGVQGPSPDAAGQKTPGDVMAQADQIATQLLNMQYEQRRPELLKLKKSNELLYSVVKSKMENMRTQARSAGGPQVLQQMVGQAAQQGQGNVPQA
jgi:hypothetical protein